jgi:hypothetical protein
MMSEGSESLDDPLLSIARVNILQIKAQRPGYKPKTSLKEPCQGHPKQIKVKNMVSQGS